MDSIDNQRFIELLNELTLQGKITSDADFARKTGVGRSYVSELKNNRRTLTPIYVEQIRSAFNQIDISARWLLSGEGEMLLEEKEDKPKLIPSNPQEGIPLIPASAMAGALLGFQEIDHSELTFYKIPSFRGAEYLISIRGDSMIPKYLSGDLVACRNVPLNNLFFQWGKTYVLDTEQGALIKRVERAEEEGSVLLVSENPNYKPFSIPISEIYHIAMIVGVIRGE